MIFNVGAGGGASTADKVKYDNTESGLQSDNVQGAVDELNSSLTETYIYRVDLTAIYSSSENYTANFKLDIPSECPFTPSEVFTQAHGLAACYTSSAIDAGKISIRINTVFSGNLTFTVKIMLIK